MNNILTFFFTATNTAAIFKQRTSGLRVRYEEQS